MKIMKFGGASLGSGEKILHVARLVKDANKNTPIVLIVSAMQYVTNSLVTLFDELKSGNIQAGHALVRLLYDAHSRVLHDLGLSKENYDEASKQLLILFGQLSFYIMRNHLCSQENYDYIVSFGERLSALLVSTALNSINLNACVVSGGEVIVASKQCSNAKAFLHATQYKARKVLLGLLKENVVPVVTGFFASAKDGTLVTLGRGGSDYSATILAYALNAKEVILWKEVDGVFSTDPNKNRDAKFFSELSYKQALFLAQNGAKVLHPEAMKPVAVKEIPVWVKNTGNPENKGTRIWKEGF